VLPLAPRVTGCSDECPRSLARPGGNVTGLSSDTGSEIWGKRLELSKETLVPVVNPIGLTTEAESRNPSVL
jgi:ABC-type uncharacterized transport system substrate-binding protein